MNDSELDGLLNTWETPAPSSGLRAGISARFPGAERRGFRFSLRWVLAVAAVSITLAVAMGQEGGSVLGQLTSAFHMERLRAAFMAWVGPRQAHAIFQTILESQPKVYIDGELQVAPTLHTWHAATMWIDVPGEGTYLFSTYKGDPSFLARAGSIHGNVVQFQAGAKEVRIECSTPIVNIDRVVFASLKP